MDIEQIAAWIGLPAAGIGGLVVALRVERTARRLVNRLVGDGTEANPGALDRLDALDEGQAELRAGQTQLSTQQQRTHELLVEHLRSPHPVA